MNNQPNLDVLPENLPPGSECEVMGITYHILDADKVAKGIIPAVAFDPNNEIRYMIDVACGHYVPFDPTPGVNLKSVGRLFGKSHTGKYVCKVHLKNCAAEGCGKLLCIQGEQDGYGIYLGNGKGEMYFCKDHFKTYRIKRCVNDFIRGFSYFF
jgi:hypothetical protein